ncbi:MAG TPA: hypothetical protein VFL67_05015 [Mycobacterium sp.]|nr:hypothetical protein [Mycobacterium sp.]
MLQTFNGSLGYGLTGVLRSNATESNVTVTTSATAYNNITPVQLVASTAFDAHHLTLRIATNLGAATTRASTVVEVMLGAAASEYTIIGPVSLGNRLNPMIISLPVYIPSGSRISVRFRCARISLALSVSVDYYGYMGGDTPTVPNRWIAYGLTDDATANAQGTSITPGASNAFGSWTSIVSAATTYPHDLWVPVLDQSTQSATGTAGTMRSQFAIATTTDAATEVTAGTVWDGPMATIATTPSIIDRGLTVGCGIGLPVGGNGIIYKPTPAGSSVSCRAMFSTTLGSNLLGASVLAAL